MFEFDYGEFSKLQMDEIKERLRKQIFFLLLIVDPKTAEDYDVDVDEAFIGTLDLLGGVNGLLNYPHGFVEVMALVYAAYLEFQKPSLNWGHYRKLILDAGSSVCKVRRGGDKHANS